MVFVDMQNFNSFIKLFEFVLFSYSHIPKWPCFCSIQYVLSYIDTCIQYGEDADVKVRDFEPIEDDD